MRIEAFVQARMGSSRLPGKVLKEVLGRPLLSFLISRLREASSIDDIVILTTLLPEDDVIVSFCQENGVAFFRGDSHDVLYRYALAAQARKVDGVVRITADCPLIDPTILDEVVFCFRQSYPKFDYVSNTLKRTYPRGLDVEVFSNEALQKAHQEATRPQEKEHVTLYMYSHPEIFSILNIEHTPPMGHHRWTVDTEEDFSLIKLILTHLFPQNPYFRMNDILHLLNYHPHWEMLNAHICQKSI